MRWIPSLAVTLLLLFLPLPPVSAGVVEELRAAQQRANKAAGELSRAETELALVEGKLGRLKTRAADLIARFTSLKGAVQEVAVLQYVAGGREATTWLSNRDINIAARASELAKIATVSAVNVMEQYRVAREDLEIASSALDKQAKARRASLSSLRERRAKALAEVEKLAKQQKTLEARARAEAARRRALPSPRSVLPKGPAIIIGSGPWICPVQGPHAFTNSWGAPRSGGRRHKGTDIIARMNTPVVASVAGTVVNRSGGLGGLAYHLRGVDGNTYYGAHLSRFGATGRVDAGTVIGYVGDTGNARGGTPHLHFEIRPRGGAAVNPYPTLRRYC